LLSSATVALVACGSSEKVVAGPEPAKVTWGPSNSSEADRESESGSPEPQREAATPVKSAGEKAAPPAPEPEADTSEDVEGAIDLDAMAAAKAAENTAEPETEPPPAADPVAAELQRRRAEKARRTAKNKKGRSKKAAAPRPSSSEPAAGAYTGSDPCRASKFSVPRVREACENGGRPAAKRVMKDAIGKATATGQLLKCSDCHSNQRDYALKSNAVAELKRWLDK
jgi:hypothetical protein